MRIGTIECGDGLYLAPMAGFTDKSFRRLCKRMGADVLVTEMVSAKALTYQNEKTFEYLDADPEESPLFVQLFGSEPEVMAEAAAMVESRFAGIDVNMGCPVPKVFRNHEGSALLADPERIYDIVRAMVRSVRVPVTVKIRKGIREDFLAVEAGLAAQEAGAAAVALHARTAAQMYSGRADWEAIATMKESLKIPVIGNGDIRSAGDALDMRVQTGCDGLMIGRAARGNPWIFRDIHQALAGRKPDEAPTERQIIEMLLRQTQMCIEQKGEHVAMRQMRSQIPFYIRGFRGSAFLRGKVQTLETFDELKKVLAEFSLTIPEG